MARRIDLYGKRKPPHFGGQAGKQDKKPKKELPLGRALQGFFALCVLSAAAAGFFYLFWDAGFDEPVRGVGRRTSNFCHYAYTVIPEAWKSVALCRSFNVFPFVVMPGIALVWLLGRLARAAKG